MDGMGLRSPHIGRDKSKPIAMGEYTYCDSCADENMLPKRTGKKRVAYCIGCDKFCNCNVADDRQLQIHGAKVAKEIDKQRERR